MSTDTSQRLRPSSRPCTSTPAPTDCAALETSSTEAPEPERALEWFETRFASVVKGNRERGVAEFFRRPGSYGPLVWAAGPMCWCVPAMTAVSTPAPRKCRNRLAPHAHDSAWPRSARMRRRAPVQRYRAAIPERSCRRYRGADLAAPHTLAAAVLLVATLGGDQNRKHDPPLGHRLMWRGYERLSIATLGYRMAERRHPGAGIVQNELGAGLVPALRRTLSGRDRARVRERGRGRAPGGRSM